MAEPTVASRIEQAVRVFIQACNDGDAGRIAVCMHPDAVQYYPNAPKWDRGVHDWHQFLEESA